jgi:ribosomal protein L44E
MIMMKKKKRRRRRRVASIAVGNKKKPKGRMKKVMRMKLIFICESYFAAGFLSFLLSNNIDNDAILTH